MKKYNLSAYINLYQTTIVQRPTAMQLFIYWRPKARPLFAYCLFAIKWKQPQTQDLANKKSTY